MWHQPYQRCKYVHHWIFKTKHKTTTTKNVLLKGEEEKKPSHSCEHSEFAREQRIELYKSDQQINKQTKPVFGLDYDNSVKTDGVFRFIILFAKHYVYQCKRNMSLSRVDIFQKQLQLRYKVEEYNAKILTRQFFLFIFYFYKSWCNYEALFSE